MHRPPALTLAATAALTLSLAASTARAQVEARCPPGFAVVQPIAPAAEGQRPVVACARPPLSLGAVQIDRAIPAGDEAEGGLAVQIAMRAGLSPPSAPPAVQSETIAGVPARVVALAGAGQSPEGAPVQIEAEVLLFHIGGGTLIVRGLSSDATRGHVHAALRAFVPTMVGLDGSAPAWRASMTCPAGMSPANADPPTNGMRRVAMCAAESEQRQLDVLESRLPLRNAADARAEAEHYAQVLSRGLAQLGGRATVDNAAPATFGSVQGFTCAVHASANDPRAQPGAPSAAIRIEYAFAFVPTSSGHVQLVGIQQDGDASALAAMVRAAATAVRTDGVGVVLAATGASDGGAAAGAAPPRRRHEIDPSQPLWTGGPVDRPTASAPPPRAKGVCGCRAPGAARSDGRALTALALALGAAWARRRRRSART